MKFFLIFLVLLGLSFQSMAQVPRAYYSTSKGQMVVDGKESTFNPFTFSFKVPGEFSDNPESHELYKKYLTRCKWGTAFTWLGLVAMIVGGAGDSDAAFIGGALTYVGGVVTINRASMKLQKAINIYNGVSPDLAWEKDLRNPRQSSAQMVAWKFEF